MPLSLLLLLLRDTPVTGSSAGVQAAVLGCRQQSSRTANSKCRQPCQGGGGHTAVKAAVLFLLLWAGEAGRMRKQESGISNWDVCGAAAGGSPRSGGLPHGAAGSEPQRGSHHGWLGPSCWGVPGCQRSARVRVLGVWREETPFLPAAAGQLGAGDGKGKWRQETEQGGPTGCRGKPPAKPCWATLCWQSWCSSG